MLQFIRNKAKGWIAWVIVILISIPFALWGVNEYFSGGGADAVAAKVGDREVSVREFQNLYQRELMLRRQVLGDGFDPTDPAIRRDALDRLINTEVMSQAAIKSGFRIDDTRLGRQIRSMEEFQSNGRFDPEQYDRLLRISGMSRAQFEESLRRDLMMEQMIAGVSETALLTDRDLDRWLRLLEQERRFEYLLLTVADYIEQVEVDDEQIQRYYRDNIDLFAVPEQVTAEYLELSLSGLREDIEVADETLRRMYDERSAMLSVGEERRARHILIDVDADADAGTIENAQELAAELLSRIDEGESFEELAREYSDDGGSAAAGGDLGFFGRGTMVGSFEEAVFSLQEGEVAGPVRSPFGLHIIRLDRIRPGTTPSFEEVRARLEDEYRNARAEERFFDLTELLAELTFEHPDTLIVAAEELGLSTREAGPFSRDQGEGIADEAIFRQTAFSNDVLEAGNNSPLIEMGRDEVVVLRVKDRHPASHLALEEVRDRITRELIEQGAARKAEQEGQRLLERLTQGETLEELAREHGLEYKPSTLAKRDDGSLHPDVLSTVFSIPRPRGDEPALKGEQFISGDFAVIALHEVVEGDPGTVAPEQRSRLAQEIAAQLRQRAAEDLLDSLKDRMEVRVYEDRL